MPLGNIQPNPAEIIDRSAEPDRFDNRGRARFEALRRRRIFRSCESHPVDHRAATLIGRHFGEDVGPRPQGANAGRPVKLVCAECVEIAIERRHVHLEPGNGLAPIEQQFRTNRVSQFGCAPSIDHRTEHVGDVCECHQLVLARKHPRGSIEIDPAVLGQRANIDHSAGSFRNQLPRHDVGMMFQQR